MENSWQRNRALFDSLRPRCETEKRSLRSFRYRNGISEISDESLNRVTQGKQRNTIVVNQTIPLARITTHPSAKHTVGINASRVNASISILFRLLSPTSESLHQTDEGTVVPTTSFPGPVVVPKSLNFFLPHSFSAPNANYYSFKTTFIYSHPF